MVAGPTTIPSIPTSSTAYPREYFTLRRGRIMDTVASPPNTWISIQVFALPVQGHVPDAIEQVPIAQLVFQASLPKEAYAQIAVVVLSAPTIQPTAR